MESNRDKIWVLLFIILIISFLINVTLNYSTVLSDDTQFSTRPGPFMDDPNECRFNWCCNFFVRACCPKAPGPNKCPPPH